MKKIAIMCAVAIAATALLASPGAYAGPFNNNMKLSNGPGPGPKPHGPKPGLSSHGHGFHGHHGHWGAVGLGGGLISAAAIADDDDCFYVRRKVFVPGVGIVKRRALVCS